MIGWLRGTVVGKQLPEVILEVGGVGYALNVSLATFETLPSVGQETTLHVMTLMRAESLQLYAFGSIKEKQIFNLLLAVSGVGPRLALAVLSGVSPDQLAQAVQDETPQVLQAIPGIGKKTASRLLLELKDKLEQWAPAREAASPEKPLVGQVPVDAVAALEGLGYRKSEAEKAVEKALADKDVAKGEGRAVPVPDLAGLIRASLRQLGAR